MDIQPIDRLLKGSSFFICGRYLKSLPEIERQNVYNHLEYERFEAKLQEIMDTYYNDAGQNWNQVIFLHFMQSLGDMKNKHVYRSLAKAVGYNAILRERNRVERIEALLLGASGLLKDFPQDIYTIKLHKEASFQLSRNRIMPLKSTDWNLYKVRPQNHPIIRLSQAAKLFSCNDMLLDKVLACRTLEDIESIFLVESSEYWTTHYVPGNTTAESVKRLGHSKCNMLGINFVVMVQYAYGKYVRDEAMVDRAYNLLQDLAPEHNVFTKCWSDYGITPQTAYESQAMLQLVREYCKKGRCKECYVGAMAQRDMSWLDRVESI